MEIKIRHIILSAVICLFGVMGFAQDQHPPEPRMNNRMTRYAIPCGDNQGGDPPPPTGLCLPINDYVYPLLILGVLLGAYKIQKMEAKS